MDDLRSTVFPSGLDGLRVEALPGVQVASLRYFDRAGSFVGLLQQALGQPLPQPQRAALTAAGNAAASVLAWRSPTETLLLCSGAAVLAELGQRLDGAPDGCVVDQTGGISVLRVLGPRAGELLQRLGAMTAIPGLGEARGGRLAEVLVLTVCVKAAEYLLFVERVYAPHLIEWIRLTLADFP
jgi:heterotetrameric sarcosine oxidase gamma subunit